MHEERRTPRHPVFIVGSPRSGTSILVDAMLAAGYSGYREGNFLSLIASIDTLVERHFKTFANGNPKVLASVVDRENLKAQIFAVVQQTAARANTTEPWFDKTGNPDMIRAIPVLRRFWPDSVFLFAKRRAIENVLSRVKKFPGHGFEQHCLDWAKNMAAWREVRAGLPPERFLEIDQQAILRTPERVSQSLCAFLGLNPARAEKLTRTFRVNRPQQTSEGSAARVATLESTGWSPEQVALFSRHCKPEMDAFGYTMGEDYGALEIAMAVSGTVAEGA